MPNNPSLYELELDNSLEDTGSQLSTGYQLPDYLQKYNQQGYDLDRAAELKRKELYRKGKLKYESNGELINDSNAMIRAKEVANTGIGILDSALEASEGLVDFGQGDWIGDNDRFKAEINGRKYNMSNKDIIGARKLGPNATEILAQQYRDAPEDPMAKGGVYTLKKFDGYNPDGTPKYLYKYGYAHDGALERYKNQWIQDGYQIVDEKKFVGAEDWENKWHASPGALENRTLDLGNTYDENGEYVRRDEASGINFGDGSTELYNKDILGVDVGKTQDDYDRNKLKSQAMQNAFNRRPKDSNWIDALQSGSVSMVADLGDFILDALTPGNNTLLDDLSDSDYTDKMFGFDRVGQTQKLHEALGAFKKGDIVDAVKNTALAAPSMLAESIPYMIGMSIGAGEAETAMGVAKAINGINKAKKAGVAAENIAKMTNRLKKMKGYDTYKKYEDMPNIMAKADALLKNKGFLATHTANVEDQLDQRVQNKIAAGEDPNLSIGEMAGIWTYMLPFTYLDKIAFTDALKGKGLNKVIKQAVELAPKDVRSGLFAKAAKNAARIAGSGAEEAAQEYLQTWSELFGSNWGVDGKTFTDVLSDQSLNDQALMGAIGGLGAGGLTSGITSVPGIAKDVSTGLYKKWDQKKKVNNAEAIINNLDDTDFNMVMEDWDQVIQQNKEVINNIKDINDATQRASTVEDLINSPIENIQQFGNDVRDMARGIAVQSPENIEKTTKELGPHIALNEYTDENGNFMTYGLPQMYKLLKIDPTEPGYMDGDPKEVRERHAKEINQAYEALSPEEKLNVHKLDAMKENDNPVILFANLYKNNNKDVLQDIEKTAFDKNGIVDTKLKIEDTKRQQAEKLIKEQEERMANYKEARDEAKKTGTAKSEFAKQDINLDAFDKDPVGFVNKIKSFGRKSKIVEKIKGYSDESLKKAFQSDQASKAMKAAILQVLDTRNKVKTETTALERPTEAYSTQIDNLKTRYTSEALNRVKDIIKDKTYNYAEERDDAIRFVNEAYSRGKITDEERQDLVLDIGLKTAKSQISEPVSNAVSKPTQSTVDQNIETPSTTIEGDPSTWKLNKTEANSLEYGPYVFNKNNNGFDVTFNGERISESNNENVKTAKKIAKKHFYKILKPQIQEANAAQVSQSENTLEPTSGSAIEQMPATGSVSGPFNVKLSSVENIAPEDNRFAFNKAFKNLEQEYINGKITEKEKIEKQNELIQKYSAGSLKYAGEENLNKVEQIPKYNQETFNAIRAYAGKNKIEYTQERDRALALIDAGLKSGHITEDQAKTLKRRIKKISEGAQENPDNKVYEKFKKNIIKTASDLEEQLKKNIEERDTNHQKIMDLTWKTMTEGDLTKEEQQEWIQAKKNILELEAISKEYIYFTDREKELNNIVDQFWGIEPEEMTEKEMIEDKTENQFLFEFCK